MALWKWSVKSWLGPTDRGTFGTRPVRLSRIRPGTLNHLTVCLRLWWVAGVMIWGVFGVICVILSWFGSGCFGVTCWLGYVFACFWCHLRLFLLIRRITPGFWVVCADVFGLRVGSFCPFWCVFSCFFIPFLNVVFIIFYFIKVVFTWLKLIPMIPIIGLMPINFMWENRFWIYCLLIFDLKDID